MIEKVLNIEFSNKELINQAITHPSLSRDGADYERLEFLGDSILGLIISEQLFRRYPDEDEGQLTKRLAGLICGETLVKVATDLDLGSYLLLSSSEENGGGRKNKANLENAMEAVIGAVYLDKGFDIAQAFVLSKWDILISEMIEPPKDAKSALQEWAQGKGLPLPEYKVESQDGPSHAPEFTISVSVEGHGPETGEGTSKRIAEQEAAGKLLEVLT